MGARKPQGHPTLLTGCRAHVMASCRDHSGCRLSRGSNVCARAMQLCSLPADDAVGAQVEMEVYAKVLAQGCLLPDRCALA